MRSSWAPARPQQQSQQYNAQERQVPAQQQQGPIFRTVQAGNQNRTAQQQQLPAQKTSLFASLFGGKKARR